jgi:hypothetical protein
MAKESFEIFTDVIEAVIVGIVCMQQTLQVDHDGTLARIDVSRCIITKSITRSITAPPNRDLVTDRKSGVVEFGLFFVVHPSISGGVRGIKLSWWRRKHTDRRAGVYHNSSSRRAVCDSPSTQPPVISIQSDKQATLRCRLDASSSRLQNQLQNNIPEYFAKMRVLCLHGMGTNSGIFEAQSRELEWSIDALQRGL